MTTYEELAARDHAAMLPTYGRRAAAFVRGEGIHLVDTEGRHYLDFLSGLAVTSLGHAHPAVTEAVARQAATLVHTSNLFYTEPQIALAERLAATLGWDDGRAFLCNSGAEANEAALKLARRHGKASDPEKVGVVALSGGFHGRTLGALLATGNPAKHAPFEPLGTWVRHVPHDDPEALRQAVDARTCAVVIEVVQGEGGVRPLAPGMLAAAREAADRVDALLVVDEVQTGIGRLGAWYGWQTTDIVPDVVCLAKALANGLPIGAIVARGTAATAFGPGDHATTFGGGPVPSAAALAVLDVMETDGLVHHAARMGAYLAEQLATVADDAPGAAGVGAAGVGAAGVGAAGVRGRGLLQALVLDHDAAAAVAAAALDRGLVVNAVAPDAIRLAPPLIVTREQVDDAVDRLRDALGAVATTGPASAGPASTGSTFRGSTFGGSTFGGPAFGGSTFGGPALGGPTGAPVPAGQS